MTLAFQVDPQDLFYASYAKGFRVGGGNAPLPSYCDADLAAAGYPNGAPLTYKSDNTQNYEIGSKNAFGNWLKIATSVYYIKWNDIQQSLYVAGDCGLQFTDNLGQADVWGGDVQAQMQFGAVHVDLAAGYTSARFSQDAPLGCQTQVDPTPDDPLPGQQRQCHLRPGRASTTPPVPSPPWTVASGSSTTSTSGRARCLRARRLGVREPQPLACRRAGSAQRRDLQLRLFLHAALDQLRLAARGRELRSNGSWRPFCDNLFDSHTVNNYSLGQTDGTYTPQQNAYTFRPRTVGLTFTWHGH